MKLYNLKTGDTDLQLSIEDIEHLDLISSGTDSFHIIDEQNKGHDVKLISITADEVTILLDGNEHTILVSDQYDLLVEKMGLATVSSAKLSTIKAPMPGLILEVLVEPGQEINDGDPLVILEAMKMENVLKASGSAVVDTIEVEKGQSVEKGQVLIEMQ